MHNIEEGDQPVGAPVKGAVTPWTLKLEYKSGKTPEGYVADATPEKAKAGINYYDKEAKERIQIKQELTCCIVAVLSGVSGTVRDAQDKYYNYSSNLIRDTRYDVLNVWLQGAPKPVYTGIYNDFKKSLPEGVGYTRFLICYVPELDQLISFELTVGLGMAVEAAIAVACGKKTKEISLFNLCDLTQFWVVKFANEFDKMTKDGTPWDGKGEMYFIPKTRAFVVTPTGKNPELYAKLEGFAKEVDEYLVAKQIRIKSFGDETSPEDENKDSSFPTSAPEYMEDNNQSVADDLPPAAPQKSKKEVFYEKLNARLATLTDPATIITGIAMLYKQVATVKLEDHGTNAGELANAFNVHYWQITNDLGGYFEGGKIIPGTTTQDNDLPF